ncbi:MAG: alpha/beta hydrolase [Thermoleophilaceae bacterium]|nr:alpha/beta hydrolase [Thermoleophilaceae bacterium]
MRPPEPPLRLPPGCLVHVPGVGEMFVRDTGGDGPPVLLLHGWMFPSDLNWWRVYEPLRQAGHRVLAIDHRGHGRGLRSPEPFRLERCAADAAALVRELGVGPVTVVGYSMGGSIAQLMARDHRDTVAALVPAGTAACWREPRMRWLWRSMGALRLALGLFPRGAWRAGLRGLGFPDSEATTWVASELSRGSSLDIAEAGRELGRFDSRAWAPALGVPAAVIVTTRDRSVPPRRQRELARLLGARELEVACDHAGVVVNADEFVPVLLGALAAVGARADGEIASGAPVG